MISDVFNTLIKNKDFCDKIEKSISNILKDSTIDQSDIPDIIIIITEVLTNHPNVNVIKEDIGNLIKKLFEYFLIKQNIATDEQIKAFDKILDASIKLFLLQPNIGNMADDIAKKINSCFCC